jgi:hypothetical protein
LLTVDQGKQHLRCYLAKLLGWLPHYRQWRTRNGSPRMVIEANQRNVLSATQTEFLDRQQCSQTQQVII